MATQTQTAPTSPPPPHITVLTRVASIPLISDSLAAVHATLAGNAYTKAPYTTAQAWGSAAYRVTSPIQTRLAPVIVRADGFANSAIDVVESRYPYPFTAPTEEIYGTLKLHGEHAYGYANKTIDDKVRTPAYGIVQGIDQRFTPVVDRLASVVNSISAKQVHSEPDADRPPGPATVTFPSSEPGSSNDTFQYQRAYRLSLDLKDTLYVFTNEQIKQIQEHNILVQRATTTAQTISNTVTTSYSNASARVHALSDTMLAELHTLQTSASALPAQAQASLNDLSSRLSPVIAEVKETLTADAPVADKLARLRLTVEQQVKPILAGATARVQGAVSSVRARAEDAKPPMTNGVESNGNGVH